MFADSEKKFLNMLQDKGVKMTIFSCTGLWDIDVDEVEQYINNPNDLHARLHGVSVAIFNQWKDIYQENNSCWFQCHAKTLKGKRCKNEAYLPEYISEYDPTVDNYCNVHRRLG
jgi:hypothetical protein